MEKKKTKLAQRRWFRITAIVVVVLTIALFGVDLYIRSSAIPECGTATADAPQRTAAIKCPFLKIVKPAQTSRSAFVKDCEKFGMDYSMAQFVAIQVGWQQKGLWSVIKGEAPDVYSLDQVRGVTHCDLYSKYLPELEQQAQALEVNGQITLQDLVELKKWVAKQEQVAIIEPSKLETALLFVKAGGNLETQKVFREDVFTFLRGELPERHGQVTIALMNQARSLADWD